MLDNLAAPVTWDLVIIGGGATGLGAAVDAGTRGYRTLLIEQYDFAKGTSSKATKLVHGGVRYLAQGNIKLVREALRERSYLLKNAPQITRKLGFIVPVYSWFDKFFYGTGLKIYDLLSGRLSIGKTKWLSRAATLEKLPTAKAKGLVGGILYFDGQFDDSRLAIDLAATAAGHGVTILNYCQATSFTRTGDQITGVKILDTVFQKEYAVTAKVVINATGVFTDAVLKMDDPRTPGMIAASQGVHLVIGKSFFPGDLALMIPKTDDGRVLFAVPWHGQVILGTTDTPVQKIGIDPQPMAEEIEFILRNANRYLNVQIQPGDVNSIFAGLRPLVKKSGAKNTAVLNRDHTILISASGLITITGGKWTTYRKMAEDVIDHAIATGKLPPKKCVTKNIAIANPAARGHEDRLADPFSMHPDDIDYLIENEMAMTVEDILARRKRILFLNARKAMELAPELAVLMAGKLGRDAKWIQDQLTSFNELAKQYCLAN